MSDEWIEIDGVRLSPDQVRDLLSGPDNDLPGVPTWLLPEAIASVAMSHDPEAQTYSLEEGQ